MMVEASKKISAQAFSCPNCGASVTVRALGQTLTVGCPSCGSIIDASNNQFKLFRSYNEKITVQPLIPLGKTGALKNIFWQVLGFLEKSDSSGQYKWHEYILFNPYFGYRFLVENQRHWSFVSPVRQHIQQSKGFRSVFFREKVFDLFDDGGSIVCFVLGEFYWQINLGDRAKTKDYISPPLMLSMEEELKEQVWSCGEYIESHEIAKAFGLSNLPEPVGYAPHQPSPWVSKLRNIKYAALIFLSFLIVFQIYHVSVATSETVASFHGFYSKTSGPSPELLTSIDNVVLSPGEKNLEIFITTSLRNSWFELSGQIIDSDGEEVRDFEVGTEYYSGYDDEGSWSEGSRYENQLLPGLDSGSYKILLSYAGLSDQTLEEPLYVEVTIKKNVPLWQNFYIAVFLILGLWLWVYLIARRFESERWSTSSENDDED